LASSECGDPVERHFREYDLEGHKAACIEGISKKYQEEIDEKAKKYSRSDAAQFRDEIRKIEKLKSGTYAT
jgi:hypothetical protein